MFPYLLPMDPNTGEIFDETGLFLPTAQDALDVAFGRRKGVKAMNDFDDDGPSYGEMEEAFWGPDDEDIIDRYGYPENHHFHPMHSGVLNTPRPKKEVKRWNGQPVRRMDSEHLMNAILWCERKFATAQSNYLQCHSRSDFYFSSVEDMYPDYKHLREEWEIRKNES